MEIPNLTFSCRGTDCFRAVFFQDVFSCRATFGTELADRTEPTGDVMISGVSSPRSLSTQSIAGLLFAPQPFEFGFSSGDGQSPRNRRFRSSLRAT